MPELKELSEKRLNLWERSKELMDRAATEKRDLSTEEATEFDKLSDEIDSLKAQIDRQQRARDFERDFSTPQPTKAAGRQSDDDVPASKNPEYRKAFRNYLRFGISEMPAEERAVIQRGFQPNIETRAQSIGVTTAGGYTVPQDFADQIVTALKAYGGMRQANTTKLTTDNGQTLLVPVSDDTTQVGAILAENTTAPAQDVAFGQKSIGAFMYTSKLVLVSLQLLQDSAFDIEAFLVKALANRIGRITNTHFTVGTGTTQPNGVVPAAGVGKVGATGQTLTVTYADIVDLMHSVDPLYRANGAQFMFSDSSLKGLKKILDTTGRPIWQPGLAGFAASQPDSIIGQTYVINQDLPAMAANAKSILYGDFSTYWIRDVTGATVLRLTERYADALQVGFLAFERHDGQPVFATGSGSEPIKYYQNSAT